MVSLLIIMPCVTLHVSCCHVVMLSCCHVVMLSCCHAVCVAMLSVLATLRMDQFCVCVYTNFGLGMTCVVMGKNN